MGTAQLIVLVSVVVFTTIALLSDLWTRKLPNVLTVSAFCAGLLFHVVHGAVKSGPSGAVHDLVYVSLAGFAVGFGIMLVLWFVGGSGGGDVKFMGALGCWLGPWLTFQVLVVSAIFAAALTLAMTIKNTFQLKRTPLARHEPKAGRGGRKRAGSWSRVPYGVPAAVATWFVLGLDLAGYALEWPPIH
jgi:prepilin peptidase CpaA